MSARGLFETLLVRDGRALQVEEHLARMIASSRALGFPLPDADAFRRACIVDAEEAALRVTWSEPWTLSATVSAIPAVTLDRRTGARAITLEPSLRRELPQHKLVDREACVIALRRAMDAGANEAFFMTPDGGVLEGTSTNVFAVAGETLITAGEGILPGIVRAAVLEQAKRVELRPPSVDELRRGGFVTGSLTGIAPIVAIWSAAAKLPL